MLKDYLYLTMPKDFTIVCEILRLLDNYSSRLYSYKNIFSQQNTKLCYYKGNRNNALNVTKSNNW